LKAKLDNLANEQDEQVQKQDRNYVDIWEPKKFMEKVTSFLQNTYEIWVVAWISAISYYFSSMVSAIFLLTFSFLFIGMVQT
jgi:hypothetical protein